jgi:hypothetical protein
MKKEKWWSDALYGLGPKYIALIWPYIDQDLDAQNDVKDHMILMMDEMLFQDALDNGLKGIK